MGITQELVGNERQARPQALDLNGHFTNVLDEPHAKAGLRGTGRRGRDSLSLKARGAGVGGDLGGRQAPLLSRPNAWV